MAVKQHSNKWFGCKRDLRDARDHHFVPKAARLPASVDLRANCAPVLDQGALGSCVSHGVTGALRHALKVQHDHRDFHMCRLQNYYDSRAMEGTINEDAGCEIRDGIKAAANLGIGHETIWPYIISKFTKKPPPKTYVDALHFKALEYQRVNVSIADIKAAIAEGYPVVIGITVYESFESLAVEKTGVVPYPDVSREQILGGHCMLAVGYNQHLGYITVRNSWGINFGDEGDLYLPEKYAGSTSFGGDYWIITHEGVA